VQGKGDTIAFRASLSLLIFLIDVDKNVRRGHATGKEKWDLEEIFPFLLLEEDIQDLEIFDILEGTLEEAQFLRQSLPPFTITLFLKHFDQVQKEFLEAHGSFLKAR
jgi:hypothetical protein